MQTRYLGRAEIEAAIRYWMINTQVPEAAKVGLVKFPIYTSAGEAKAEVLVKDPPIDPGKGI